MSNRTISQAQQEAFINEMTQRMTELARALSGWVAAAARTLSALEQQVVRSSKDLGAALLTGLCHLLVPAYPAPQVPCSCGQAATYQRMRPAQVTTVLGPIHFTRPYYRCAHCHHGVAPLDQQLGVCAGSISAGLDEVLALLGATEDSFAQAVAVLQKLTLVEVCPNSAREATERLGECIAAAEAQAVATAWDDLPAPVATGPTPPRLYISLDGTMVHTREDGWKEIKLGAIYTTTMVRPRMHPERLEVRARDLSFVADMVEAQSFGPAIWAEAARRGVLQAEEVVVIGAGAQWIWNLVEEHFPAAIQIVDWYHASQYLWRAAHAIYGEGTELAQHWARARLDELWEGQVAAVLEHLQTYTGAGAAVQETLTYYTNNQQRMRYAEYRARGIQIGSGSIESGCNHVIGARLKQAGMLWNRDGVVAVAKVRTWLKSGRWDEAMALRPPPRRCYRRKQACAPAIRVRPSAPHTYSPTVAAA